MSHSRVRLTSLNEARYLVAYVRYLALERDWPPYELERAAGRQLTRERRRQLRGEAAELVGAIVENHQHYPELAAERMAAAHDQQT